MPAATAVSIPFSPLVFGTITLFTFLIILGLTNISILSGSSSNKEDESAEA